MKFFKRIFGITKLEEENDLLKKEIEILKTEKVDLLKEKIERRRSNPDNLFYTYVIYLQTCVKTKGTHSEKQKKDITYQLDYVKEYIEDLEIDLNKLK